MHAEPELPRHIEERDPHPARLGGHGQAARRWVAEGERGVQADARVVGHDPQTVRADQPDVVSASHAEDLSLDVGALRAELTEAGRDDDDRGHRGGRCVLDSGEDADGRDRDDGEVDVRRDVDEPGMGGHVVDGRDFGMHDEQPSLEATLDDRREHRVSHADALAPDPDHGNGLGGRATGPANSPLIPPRAGLRPRPRAPRRSCSSPP